MINEVLSLELLSNTNVLDNSNVIFDNVKVNEGLINYDMSTGVITINKVGNYAVSWWIASQASLNKKAEFTLNGSDVSNTSAPSSTFPGFSFLKVETIPYEISLVNSTGNTVYLSNRVNVKASLLIYDLKDEETETAICFSNRQMINVANQIITKYPNTNVTIFSSRLPTTSGVIIEVITPVGSDNVGFLNIETETQNIYFPIDNITGIYLPGVIYNYDIDFLSNPGIDDCTNDLIIGLMDILDTDVLLTVGMGPSTTVNAYIVENEYACFVMASETNESPIFIMTYKVVYVNIPK